MAVTVSPNYRRGCAKSAHGQEAVETWQEFAREHNISDKNVASYYGISTSAGYLSAPQTLRVIKELFRDLVTANALTLPQGMSVKDYEIMGERSPRPPHLDGIMLRDPRSQRQAVITNHATNWTQASAQTLHSESKMNGPQVHRMVRAIVQAIDML
jgi:hypothetical protein